MNLDLTISLTVKEIVGVTEIHFGNLMLGAIVTRTYSDTGKVYGYQYGGKTFQSKEKAIEAVVAEVTNEFEKHLRAVYA